MRVELRNNEWASALRVSERVRALRYVWASWERRRLCKYKRSRVPAKTEQCEWVGNSCGSILYSASNTHTFACEREFLVSDSHCYICTHRSRHISRDHKCCGINPESWFWPTFYGRVFHSQIYERPTLASVNTERRRRRSRRARARARESRNGRWIGN